MEEGRREGGRREGARRARGDKGVPIDKLYFLNFPFSTALPLRL